MFIWSPYLVTKEIYEIKTLIGHIWMNWYNILIAVYLWLLNLKWFQLKSWHFNKSEIEKCLYIENILH